jgi:hypothetical protein
MGVGRAMMIEDVRHERASLLRRHAEALNEYETAIDRRVTELGVAAAVAVSPRFEGFVDTAASRRARERLIEAAGLEQAYFELLPRLPLSTCPFDGRPLHRSFDPFGLDGLWWRRDAAPEETAACPHFCVLLGAVNFRGHTPPPVHFEVGCGPEAPFVIPRLLELPGVLAVISRLEMTAGHHAYPIAYFAERRPPPQQLTASWARNSYHYTTQLGEDRWRAPRETHDYDLAPWLEEGKVRWRPPDDDTLALAGLSERCPFVGIEGARGATTLLPRA